MIRELVSRIVEKLAKCLADPVCGEGAAGHVRDEDVSDGAAELASGERVDGDAMLPLMVLL